MSVKPWTMKTAIEQVEKCDFECEGGPLANNDAWRWLKEQAAAGPEFWPGQRVWFEVKATAHGVTLSKSVPFFILACTAGSTSERREWAYTLTDALPDAYFPGGKTVIPNVSGKQLSLSPTPAPKED